MASSKSLFDHLNSFRRKAPNGFYRMPRVECVDGFSVSIQASQYNYCSPREFLLDITDYHTVELGYPNRYEPMIDEYAEDKISLDTVFAYVPLSTVLKVINSHGGLK